MHGDAKPNPSPAEAVCPGQGRMCGQTCTMEPNGKCSCTGPCDGKDIKKKDKKPSYVIDFPFF